jgi:hypothetical protein
VFPFTTEVLFFAILAAIPVVTIWGIIDAAKRPTYAWEAAGQARISGSHFRRSD